MGRSIRKRCFGRGGFFGRWKMFGRIGRNRCICGECGGGKGLFALRAGAAEGEKFVGSLSFVPSAAGLLLAGEIVKDLAFGRAEG